MIKKLEKLLGKENVLSSKADKISYNVDASQLEGRTYAIVFPKFNNDVRKLIKFAGRNGLNVVPRGAGTGLAGGTIPQKSLILDFSRMRRILLLNRKTRTIVVEPGVVIKDLNEQLAEHGLFFPIVPSSQRVCTIGGMIATNAAGYRAVKYGKTFDWVAELEVVDGTGKMFVFKKANDFIGSEGILGIITKAKLKLTELPILKSMSFTSFEKISDLVVDVQDTLDRPNLLGVEYFSSTVAEMLGLNKHHYLIIEYEDDQGDIKDPDEMLKIIDIREGIGPNVSSSGYMYYEDPKIPLKNMDKFIEWLEKHDIPNFGHIGLGIIHPRFMPGQEKLIPKMFKVVEKLGGDVSGEHGIGLTKKKFVDKEFVSKLKKLKKKYDPYSILNVRKVI